MICVAIVGPGIEEAKRQIRTAMQVADFVELYLDAFTIVDIEKIKELIDGFCIPMLVTLRSKEQGGTKEYAGEERRNLIRELAALKPTYLDVESSDPSSFVQEIAAKYPEIKLILSHHDFEKMPELESVFQDMRATPTHFYKIAAMAKNSLDTLRMLSWKKEKSRSLITVSMGPFGQISRIVAPLFNNPVTYASVATGQESAPGQLPAITLMEQYGYASLSSATALYGLIGDPVSGSISDKTHNHLFHTFKEDAVYVKIPVKQGELGAFLEEAKNVGVKGLSVTMPLKEAVLPFVDEMDPEAKKIGAVNTLRFDRGKIFGYNTDGFGALNALEKTMCVKDKRVAILGAGGAAKAIAYEARRRGAELLIVNRNIEKAKNLSDQLGGKAIELEALEEEYDILINTTPSELPMDPSKLLEGSLVMDIKTRPKDTLLLKHAKERGCQIVYGYEMFIEQALGQFHLWFDGRLPTSSARSTLTSIALKELT